MKDKEYWLKWLRASAIRALKTVAQTATGMITVGAAMEDIKWAYVGSVALVSGILSILTSIVGLPEVEVDGSKDGDSRE